MIEFKNGEWDYKDIKEKIYDSITLLNNIYELDQHAILTSNRSNKMIIKDNLNLADNLFKNYGFEATAAFYKKRVKMLIVISGNKKIIKRYMDLCRNKDNYQKMEGILTRIDLKLLRYNRLKFDFGYDKINALANMLITANSANKGIIKYDGIMCIINRLSDMKLSKRIEEVLNINSGFIRYLYNVIYADNNAKYNMQQAAANGIKVGVYFFSSAVNESEAIEEAGWVADYIANYNITYPVAFDCEGFDYADSRQNGMSNDDRTNVADAFLQKLGYGDFVCCGTEIGAYRERDEDPDTMSANLIDHWYCFSYSRKVDGISAAVTAGVNDLRFGVSGELTAPQETIDVTVDAQGVATVKIQANQYELEEEGTGITSYLTFEQVDAAAQKYMSEYKQPDYITKNVPQAVSVTHVKLNYAYVRYTDGNYNMIPVWAYYGYQFEQNPYQERYSGDASPRECFLFGVSAVDGQIIEGVYSKVVDNPFDL